MDVDSEIHEAEKSPNRPRVSGVITSFNEEHNIADCIESLLWCDEIILVDSFSTDATVEIARKYDKVRLFQRDYFGAHSYERTDKPRGKFFHTDWTGHGGKTASSTYNI